MAFSLRGRRRSRLLPPPSPAAPPVLSSLPWLPPSAMTPHRLALPGADRRQCRALHSERVACLGATTLISKATMPSCPLCTAAVSAVCSDWKERGRKGEGGGCVGEEFVRLAVVMHGQVQRFPLKAPAG
eukprot:1032143-Rhodomonas_salina.2